jgi:hypothetical protein
VQLEINRDLQRSEVFGSQNEALTAGEQWKRHRAENGVGLIEANRNQEINSCRHTLPLQVTDCG